MANKAKDKGKSAKKDKGQPTPPEGTGTGGATPPQGGTPPTPPEGDGLAEKKARLKTLENAHKELEAEEDKRPIDMTVAGKRNQRLKEIERLKGEIKALDKGK